MKNPTKANIRDEDPASIDPALLWNDPDIAPEALLRLDPLDITSGMVERAEQPELADPLIAFLPERSFSLKLEILRRRAWRKESERREKERVENARRGSP